MRLDVENILPRRGVKYTSKYSMYIRVHRPLPHRWLKRRLVQGDASRHLCAHLSPRLNILELKHPWKMPHIFAVVTKRNVEGRVAFALLEHKNWRGVWLTLSQRSRA